MPEYFEISLIIKKTEQSKEILNKCLAEKFDIYEGKREVEYFNNKEIIVSSFLQAKDFEEITISIPEQIFHKNNFERELEVLTFFINTCFVCYNETLFALCSYELNGYLLAHVNKLQDFNNELLRKFPIVYKRQEGQKRPLLNVNLDAQEIFFS